MVVSSLTTTSLRETSWKKNALFAITHDGAEMTCGYYSTLRTAQFNGLVPYEYLVYLFDSLPYKEDKNFDYTSYLLWADGIQDRVKEHIANKFANWKKRVHACFIIQVMTRYF